MQTPFDEPLISLGDRIDAIVGAECSIYFDAILPNRVSEEWEISIDCAIGSHRSDRWTLIPERAQIGVHPLSVNFRNPRTGRPGTLSSRLQIHAQTVGTESVPAAWLPIGDSLTANAEYIRALMRCAGKSGSHIKSLGTQAHGEPPLRHEGYPGWKFADFLSKAPAAAGANMRVRADSPFLSPGPAGPCLDFAAYIRSRLGENEPDFITVFLGANDIALLNEGNRADEIKKSLANAENLVTGLLRGTEKSHVGLIPVLPPSASQDAFGINYGCLIPRWRYLKSQREFVAAMQRHFEQFSSRVSIIPAFLGIDPVTGYPSRSEPINVHTSEIRSVSCNAAHPSTTGYHQIADAIYAWMVGRAAKAGCHSPHLITGQR